MPCAGARHVAARNVAGTFTVNVDTLTGNAAGAVFTAPPGVSIIGPSNTLNAGDSAVALGAAAGTAVLNVTEVASLLGNPALAAGVTLTGIATANILNTSAGVGGFSGVITGLTTANMLAGSNGDVLLGLASSGLNTALQNIGIAADSNLTAWIAPAALAGATDAVAVNVNSPNSSLDLLVTGGGNNGYETSTINSGAGTNVFDYDVNYTSLATVNAAGAGNLDMSQTVSTALNMDTLVTFEGTTATGMLSAFFGTGNAAGVNDVTVNGGSNNDNFTFDAANDAVTVRGNAGDDTFTFLSNNAGPTTFTAADLANGDAGTNRLRLQADTGALLGALVGAQIQNIQTIENFTNGIANGLITVDMTQSGSANTLDLAGDYGNQNVTVSGLINTKFVIFTGDNIDDLTLDHTSVVGTVNFTMAQTAVGGTQQIDDLIVPFGNVVNFVSAGNADVNDINGMNLVDANLSITGTKALNLGTIAEPYDFGNGVVDAATFAGDLNIVIGALRQTVIGGTGNDFINVRGGSALGTADLINLSAGGNDTVEFNTFSHGLLAPLNNTQYHSIVGFDVADDAVALLVVGAGWVLDNTGNGAPVAPGAALLTFVYTTNQALNATGAQFNFIKVDTPVNTGGLGAEQGFQVAMGPAGSIATSAATTDVAFAYYDATGQQMVLGTVFGAATSITAADHFDATVLIGMSKAAFDAFGDPNLNFVAT